MKNLMKFTAVLASAAILCGNCLTGYTAEGLHYFGVTDNGTLQQMQLLDPNGWLQGCDHSFFSYADENTPYYIATYHLDEVDQSDPEYYIWADMMYLTVPRQDALQFTVRKDIDRQEAETQINTILPKYFPDYRINNGYTPDGVYNISVKDETKRTEENAVSLMHELAGAGLISEFYSWGETARYKQIEHGFLTVYNANGRRSDKENGKNYEWPAIEAWVHTHHPECELVCITDKNSELGKKLNMGRTFGQWLWDDTFYAVIPPEETAFADHFALAMELYEQFGLEPCAWLTNLESGAGLMTGQNALTVAGDANLDCSADVADAVLIARFANEDRDAVITDQGKENADVTHDGKVDAQDTEKLLQYIAKKVRYDELGK